MITAVDTNILIDVLLADEEFGPASRRALHGALDEGSVVACEVVWAEVAGALDTQETTVAALKAVRIGFSAMNEVAARAAGHSWVEHRRSRGARARVVADFLIAGHAMNQADRLLTRDRGFYRRHFADLQLLEPN